MTTAMPMPSTMARTLESIAPDGGRSSGAMSTAAAAAESTLVRI